MYHIVYQQLAKDQLSVTYRAKSRAEASGDCIETTDLAKIEQQVINKHKLNATVVRIGYANLINPCSDEYVAQYFNFNQLVREATEALKTTKVWSLVGELDQGCREPFLGLTMTHYNHAFKLHGIMYSKAKGGFIKAPMPKK